MAAMNRRLFLGALATAIAAPAAPRRVYSFLWDNPLVKPVSFKITAKIHDVTYVTFDYETVEAKITYRDREPERKLLELPRLG